MSLKTIIELAATAQSDVRSSGDTVYRLLPRIWLKSIIDAAKKRHYAAQFAYTTELQKGQNDVVIPRRRKYIGSGAQTNGFSTGAENSAVNYVTITNLSGVVITPVPQNEGVAISNQAIRTNAIDLVKAAKDEMIYAAGDGLDRNVMATLNSDSNRATSTTLGSQAIYGGDATQASAITAGDTITTDMVAEAKRLLQSTNCRYWTYGTGKGTSSETKNPWQNESGNPFVLLIAPEQEEVFLTDSQFVNASEYGDPSVIRNGEIGKYLGVKIVVANNTPYYGAATTHADTGTTAVAQHRCMMIKDKKSVGLAWGLKPRLAVFDYPTNLQKRLVLEESYASSVIHPDSIVHINVSDE